MFISIGIDENGKPYVSTSDNSDHPRRTRPHKGRSILTAPDVDGLTYISGPGVEKGAMVEADIVETREYDLVALA